MKKIIAIAGALAALMFSVPAFAQDSKPSLTLCTAGKDGNYKKAGDVLAKAADKSVTVKVVTSLGSPDNLKRMDAAGAADHCDAAFVQNDALTTFKKKFPNLVSGLERSGALYDEWVHLVCNKNSGIKSITDLNENHTIAIGNPDSGSNVTWQGFKNAASSGWFSSERRYDKVKVDERKMGFAVLNSVNEGDGPQCLLYVGAFGTPFMTNDVASADFKNLVLVPANDEDMKSVKDDKGQPLYVFSEIPEDQYANIMPSGSMWGHKPVPTVGVSAVFVVTQPWVDGYEDGYEQILRAFSKSKQQIADLVKPVE